MLGRASLEDAHRYLHQRFVFGPPSPRGAGQGPQCRPEACLAGRDCPGRSEDQSKLKFIPAVFEQPGLNSFGENYVLAGANPMALSGQHA